MTYTLHLGDCIEAMRAMPDNSVDSIVTDPPYGLSFMGKKWDYDVPSVEIWVECLRVLKPGGHLLAFAGTRTQHRMAVRIEDAGFEIRDMIAWVYGSGFPKSRNLSGDWQGWGTALKPALEPITVARKPLTGTVAANVLAHGTGALNIDGCRVGWPDGKVPEIGTPGWGGPAKKLTAVPGQDGDTVERSKPSDLGRWPANLIHDGSDDVVVLFPSEACASAPVKSAEPTANGFSGPVKYSGMRERVAGAFHADTGSAARFFKQFEVTDDVWLANLSPALSVERNLSLQELADAIAQSDAVTSALPEGIALSAATEPSTSVTPSESRLIATAVIQAIPRFVTASLLGPLHDVLILSPSPVKLVARREQIGTTTITASLSLSAGSAASITFSIMPKSSEAGAKALKPSPGKFIYCAKTSRKDRNEGLPIGDQKAVSTNATMRQVEDADWPKRNGNHHPTVKPTDLMAYLLRLVTPPGGTALDPFMGSGSTGKAAMREGFQFIGCELDPEYLAIAKARIEHEQTKVAAARESAVATESQLSLFGS